MKLDFEPYRPKQKIKEIVKPAEMRTIERLAAHTKELAQRINDADESAEVTLARLRKQNRDRARRFRKRHGGDAGKD